MKKSIYTIFIISFLTIANASGQKPVMELSFTAINGGVAVVLDSIKIENQTQGGDTTLYAPNNVLTLDFATGIGNNVSGTNQFSIAQNYPNPFDGQATIHLNTPEKDLIKISIYDLLGHEVVYYSNVHDAGNHSFAFFAGKEKYYLFTATGSRGTQSIKMMNLCSSETQAKLVHQGNYESITSLKSQKAVNDFIFSLGDQLRLIGYSNTLAGIHGSDVMEDVPQTSEAYEFAIIEGIPCPGIPNVTYEGLTYKTVQVGSQCWFKENLNVGTMINGSGDQTDNGNIEKYCYDDLLASCDIYGGLYEWNEMMQYITQQGTQGICPTNWHIPSDDEWCTVTQFLDPTVNCNIIGSSGTDIAIQMKSTTGWNINGNGTNISGFTALPGGIHINNGFFYNLGGTSDHWSSSEAGTNFAWHRYVTHEYDDIFRDDNSFKYFGFSVRCLKD